MAGSSNIFERREGVGGNCANEENHCVHDYDNDHGASIIVDVAVDEVLDHYCGDCEDDDLPCQQSCFVVQNLHPEAMGRLVISMWEHNADFRTTVMKRVLSFDFDDYEELEQYAEKMMMLDEQERHDYSDESDFNDVYFSNEEDWNGGSFQSKDDAVQNTDSFLESLACFAVLVVLVVAFAFGWRKRAGGKHKGSRRQGAGFKKLQVKRKQDLQEETKGTQHEPTTPSKRQQKKTQMVVSPDSFGKNKWSKRKGKGTGRKARNKRSLPKKAPSEDKRQPRTESDGVVSGVMAVNESSLDRRTIVSSLRRQKASAPDATPVATEGDTEYDRLGVEPTGSATNETHGIAATNEPHRIDTPSKQSLTIAPRHTSVQARSTAKKKASSSATLPVATKKSKASVVSPSPQVQPASTPKWSDIVAKSTVRTSSPVAAVSPTVSSPTRDGKLLELLNEQKECIKGSPESFCDWLATEDVHSVEDLVDAVSDDDYYGLLQQGNGKVGIKGYRRVAFKKAVLACDSKDTDDTNPSPSSAPPVLSSDDDDEFPADLLCPITHVPMTDDPVVAADGHTYERAAIETWIRKQQAEMDAAKQQIANEYDSKNARAILQRGVLSPMTHAKLSHLNLIPNYSVRTLARGLTNDGGSKLNE